MQRRRWAHTTIGTLLTISILVFMPSASASVVSNTTGWCGYGGTESAGCQPLKEINFPKPTSSSQIFIDLTHTTTTSYISKICNYSHGASPDVQISSGTWEQEQFDTCYSLALAYFHDHSLTPLIQKVKTVVDTNSYSGRMTGCTKGKSIGVNPSSWLPATWTWFSCTLQVAFVPTNLGSILNDKPATTGHPAQPGIRSTAQSRIPFAYVVVGAKVIYKFVTNFQLDNSSCTNGTSTTDANGNTTGSRGLVAGTVGIPNSTNSLKLVIPCKPPTHLADLRTDLQVFIWLGTAMGLWRIGSYAVRA